MTMMKKINKIKTKLKMIKTKVLNFLKISKKKIITDQEEEKIRNKGY
jgi:hypothetical protein